MRIDWHRNSRNYLQNKLIEWDTYANNTHNYASKYIDQGLKRMSRLTESNNFIAKRRKSCQSSAETSY